MVYQGRVHTPGQYRARVHLPREEESRLFSPRGRGWIPGYSCSRRRLDSGLLLLAEVRILVIPGLAEKTRFLGYSRLAEKARFLGYSCTREKRNPGYSCTRLQMAWNRHFASESSLCVRIVTLRELSLLRDYCHFCSLLSLLSVFKAIKLVFWPCWEAQGSPE